MTFAHCTILYELVDSLLQQPKRVAVLLTNEECYALKSLTINHLM